MTAVRVRFAALIYQRILHVEQQTLCDIQMQLMLIHSRNVK